MVNPGTAKADSDGVGHYTSRGPINEVAFILESLVYPSLYRECTKVINGKDWATTYRYVINSTVSIHASENDIVAPIC